MMWREERSIKFITTIWMRNAVFRKHGCVTPAFATRIVWWSEKCVVLKHEKYLNHPIFFLWPCLSFMHVLLFFSRMLQVVHLYLPMRTFYQWQPHTSFSVTLQQRFQHLKVFLGRLCFTSGKMDLLKKVNWREVPCSWHTTKILNRLKKREKTSAVSKVFRHS